MSRPKLRESPTLAVMRYFGAEMSRENYLQFAYLDEVDADDPELEDNNLTRGDVQ